MSLLTLVRGLPGSGKSTLAKRIAEMTGAKHLEADQFFVGLDGVYRFSADRISEAHSWCQRAIYQNLWEGWDVVVSNTFVRNWELRPYVAIAEELGLPTQVIEVAGPWANVHDVSAEVLEKMRSQWEPLDRSQIKGWEW